jgi:rfaE bifunctional protein nucleotidyltransferase chain/domain
MSFSKIKIGDSFSRLTVVKLIGSFEVSSRNGKYPLFQCLCVCGNFKNVFSVNLLRGRVKSCGCLADEKRKLGQKEIIARNYRRRVPIQKYLFSFYKSNANRRKIGFDLNFDTFLEMINQKCFYCAREPFNTYCKNNRTCLYNGIDRVDNKLGYLINNVVTCCKYCNKLKGTHDVDIFLDTARRIKTQYPCNIIDTEQKLIEWVIDIRKCQRTLVVCSGVFDIFHIGHLDYFKYAKNFGDVLLVGLNDDKSVSNIKGNSRPITNQTNRQMLISSMIVVDAVYVYEKTVDFLELVKPDVWVKGEDYSIDTLDSDERNAVLRNNGTIEFAPSVYSTSQIIEKIISCRSCSTCNQDTHMPCQPDNPCSTGKGHTDTSEQA